jgi:hypothetical protein
MECTMSTATLTYGKIPTVWRQAGEPMPHMPHIGTGGLVRFTGGMAERNEAAHAHVRSHTDFSTQLKELIETCGVRKAHAARLMQVSRQAVYDWLSGSEPNVQSAHQRRLAWIHSLVDRLGDPAAAEFGNALMIHIPDVDATLLEVLAAAETGTSEVSRLMEQLAPQLAKRARLTRTGVAALDSKILDFEAASAVTVQRCD